MSLAPRKCDYCGELYAPGRENQRYCDAMCSSAGHVEETRKKRRAKRAADPQKLVAAYRRQAAAIKRWIKDVRECPHCGWSGDPLHQDGCPLAPVE